jgi:hypothetical protein
MPSIRRRKARPQCAHRPVVASLASRVMPRPDGTRNGSPGTAAGHGGTGRPGNEQLVSASTGAEGRWPRAGYQPSAPAVRVLAGEGLVEVVPGRGAYVTER